MHRPFTIARAVDRETKSIVEGRLVDRDFIKGDHGVLSFIDETSLEFNTGIVDRDGVEIFTGDTLRKFAEPHSYFEVEFVIAEGAFFIKHTEHTVHHSNRYPDPSETLVDRTDIVFQRLTQRSASQFIIDGEKIELLADETWFEPDPQSLVADHD